MDDITEPTPEAEAAVDEMSELAVARSRAIGAPVVVAGFVGSGRARVEDVDIETGEGTIRGSVPILGRDPGR
jgi:hypothetical protein